MVQPPSSTTAFVRELSSQQKTLKSLRVRLGVSRDAGP